MPTKLATTVGKIENIPNRENSELKKKFHEFMIANASSERHQNSNLKAVISFGHYLGDSFSFRDISTNKEIIAFLDTKIKSREEDSDQKWITTWNDYMHRIKHFLRWLHKLLLLVSHVAILLTYEKRTECIDYLNRLGTKLFVR